MNRREELFALLDSVYDEVNKDCIPSQSDTKDYARKMKYIQIHNIVANFVKYGQYAVDAAEMCLTINVPISGELDKVAFFRKGSADKRIVMKWSKFLNMAVKYYSLELTSEQIQTFVEIWGMYSASATYDVEIMVTPEEIVRGYEEDRYGNSYSGGSCMRNEPFPGWYGEVGAKLALLKLGGKTKGRALVWETTCGKTVLDRVYPNHSLASNVLRNYARRQGWWVRENDSYPENYHTIFVSPDGNDTQTGFKVKVQLGVSKWGWPYSDTFRYLTRNPRRNVESELLSDVRGISYIHCLSSTGGGFSNDSGEIWDCDYCFEDEGSLTAIGNRHVCNNCVQELGFHPCENCGLYIHGNDIAAIVHGCYVCPDCMERNVVTAKDDGELYWKWQCTKVYDIYEGTIYYVSSGCPTIDAFVFTMDNVGEIYGGWRRIVPEHGVFVPLFDVYFAKNCEYLVVCDDSTLAVEQVVVRTVHKETLPLNKVVKVQWHKSNEEQFYSIEYLESHEFGMYRENYGDKWKLYGLDEVPEDMRRDAKALLGMRISEYRNLGRTRLMEVLTQTHNNYLPRSG